MSEIIVVMTCHNRKDKTVNCIKKLHQGNNHNVYHYIIVDAASTDNTVESIETLEYEDVDIIHAEGTLFWNGGMHRGISEGISLYGESDYILLVNDDVDFRPGIIDGLVEYSQDKHGGRAVIVGATYDDNGKFSYGGILYGKGLQYEMLGPDRPDISCTTFNANCTLIPMPVMRQVKNVDPYYKHSMGDFDLGFRISRSGTGIYMFPEYVGQCNDNPVEGTWQDKKLGVRKRLKLKESFKGLPFKDWFHYLYKNFGLGTACLRSITPYIKIFMGK